jgi:hypothetical protein
MVIWPSGLGAGLQNLSRGFKSYYHLNRREVKDHRRLISDYRMERYHFSVRGLFVRASTSKETNTCLDGVTGAYFFYMERAGVRFPLEVQKLGSQSRSDTAARL